MLDLIVNYGTLVAFAAFITDNSIQSYRLIQRKHSDDVSIRGESIRVIAVFLLFIKFLTTSDIYLIIGQGLFMISLIMYYGLLIKYHRTSF